MTSEDLTQAYAGFKGHVGRIHSTSTPAWPYRPIAPDGAPNILVMLCDDLGYADLGCYGSEIDTPHLGPMRVPGPPIHMSATPPRVQGSGPILGFHTEAILEAAGYDWPEIEALKDSGAIRTA